MGAFKFNLYYYLYMMIYEYTSISFGFMIEGSYVHMLLQWLQIYRVEAPTSVLYQYNIYK